MHFDQQKSPHSSQNIVLFVVLCAFLGFTLYVLRDSLKAMVNVWSSSEDYSHGWLILPISLYLIWRNNRDWKDLALTPAPIALVFLLASVAFWFAGEVARVSVVKSYGLVLVVLSVIWMVAGTKFFRINFFPLLFLLAMVPAGQGLIPVLMEHTADFTIWALRVSGIAVFREGMNFVLPSGRWSVVEACSGLRYVIAGGTLALLFAYINFRSFHKQLIFVACSIAVAIVANWIRAYLIVMIGHFSQMRYGTGDDHVVYGWVFFGITMVVIFWIAGKYREDEKPPMMVNSATEPTKVSRSGTRALGFVVIVLGALSVLAAPLMSHKVFDFQALSNIEPTLRAALDAEKGPQNFPFAPAYLTPRFAWQGSLGGGVVGWTAYFARQDTGSEMLSYSQRLFAEKGPTVVLSSHAAGNARWQFTSEDQLSDNLLQTYRVRVAGKEFAVKHGFQVGKLIVGSPYAAKFVRLINLLAGKGDHSLSFAVAVELAPGQTETSPQVKTDLDRAVLRLVRVTSQAMP